MTTSAESLVERTQAMIAYYEGAYGRLMERVLALKSENSNLISAQLTILGLVLAALFFFVQEEYVLTAPTKAVLVAYALPYSASLILSAKVADPKTYADLEIDDEELATHRKLGLQEFLSSQLYWVQKNATDNETQYQKDIKAYVWALRLFMVATGALAAYALIALIA